MPIRSLNGPNVFPFACDRPSAVGVVQSILIVVGPPLGGFIFGGAFMNVFFGILNKTDGVSAFEGRRRNAAVVEWDDGHLFVLARQFKRAEPFKEG